MRNEMEPNRVTAHELVVIAAVAFALRLALFAVALPVYDMNAQEFSHLRDGRSYLRVALAMTGDESEITLFDRRVFPGYPALIALTHCVGANVSLSALLLSWVAAAGAAALSAAVFRDRRVGWGMAVLTPSYFMYSTLVMTEPTLMAFMMGGLMAAGAGQVLIGGLLLGYAGLIRPVACFAVMGYMLLALMQRRPRQAFLFGGVALAVVAVGVLGMHVWRGDALEGLKQYAVDDRAYGGESLAWPFKSLIMTPIAQATSLWKIAYIWAHVGVTLVGCGVAGILWRRRHTQASSHGDLHRLAGPWLWGNTCFVLCLGAQWGFHEFHRFMVPALPPLLWVLRRWLPSSRRFWYAAAACSFVMGLWGIRH